MEQWKRIVVDGVEYPYEVSTKGNVRNMKTGRILKPFDSHGYCCVTFRQDGNKKDLRVHRLVATAFIPNPDNLTEVDHIDRNKKNNCVENLRWVSHPVNMDNAGKRVRCVETGHIYDTVRQASVETGLDIGNIVRVCQGERKTCGRFHWEYVE